MCVVVRLHVDPLRRQLSRCDLPKTAPRLSPGAAVQLGRQPWSDGVRGGARGLTTEQRGDTNTPRG